ncbi:MAG: TPM domain-containing protein [Firmicutes bacterium]|nr:TPM domain-containing protein [Bacillota bacterium]
MPHKKRLIAALIMLMVFVGLAGYLPSAHAASSLPQPTAEFYVLDETGVLSAQTKSQIVSVSKQLAAKTKAQIVVVTLKDSREMALEDLGLGILRDWGVGDKQLNNGVVMLVIPNERKSRIEVGYGLEGALPDGKTGRIQDEYMLPYFRQGDYDKGILNGFLALAQETAKEYQASLDTGSKPVAGPNQTTAPSKLSTWQIVLIVIGLLILFFVDRYFLGGFLFGMLLSGFFRGGGGGFGGGGFGGGGSGGGGGSSRDW